MRQYDTPPLPHALHRELSNSMTYCQRLGLIFPSRKKLVPIGY